MPEIYALKYIYRITKKQIVQDPSHNNRKVYLPSFTNGKYCSLAVTQLQLTGHIIETIRDK